MDKKINNWGKTFRSLCRKIHLHLSYFFVGIILIYAISGISMNHLREFNPKYMISVKEYKADGTVLGKQDFTKNDILELLIPIKEKDNYIKHYYPNKTTLKIFLKNNSSLTINTSTGEARYESLQKRPLFYQLSFLHYNPTKWWTIFSDIFAVSLIIICLTGIFMNKGKKSIIGIGGIEMLVGILIPIIFLLIF